MNSLGEITILPVFISHRKGNAFKVSVYDNDTYGDIRQRLQNQGCVYDASLWTFKRQRGFLRQLTHIPDSDKYIFSSTHSLMTIYEITKEESTKMYNPYIKG